MGREAKVFSSLEREKMAEEMSFYAQRFFPSPFDAVVAPANGLAALADGLSCNGSRRASPAKCGGESMC
jgi:hypothetical protein